MGWRASGTPKTEDPPPPEKKTQKKPGDDTGGGIQGEPKKKEEASLQYSPYCVVFSVEGDASVLEKKLADLFPSSTLQPGGKSQRKKFLDDRLEAAAKSITDANKLKNLLVDLDTGHAIRFRGFTADLKAFDLTSIIAEGGSFRIGVDSKAQYKSLLGKKSIDQILAVAGLDKDKEARDLLDSLRQATFDYAALHDAVIAIGERQAVVLRVERTAEAHALVRGKLLNRRFTPVFFSRPLFELFGAIDPAGGEGEASDKYSLLLKTTDCFWRVVGTAARKDADFDSTPGTKKMLWDQYPADTLIEWESVPVNYKDNERDNVATFDIAIKSGGMFVVFRNQRILKGSSKTDVLTSAKRYVKSNLGLELKGVEIDDAVKFAPGKAVSGAYVYELLANMPYRKARPKAAAWK